MHLHLCTTILDVADFDRPPSKLHANNVAAKSSQPRKHEERVRVHRCWSRAEPLPRSFLDWPDFSDGDEKNAEAFPLLSYPDCSTCRWSEDVFVPCADHGSYALPPRNRYTFFLLLALGLSPGPLLLSNLRRREGYANEKSLWNVIQLKANAKSQLVSATSGRGRDKLVELRDGVHIHIYRPAEGSGETGGWAKATAADLERLRKWCLVDPSVAPQPCARVAVHNNLRDLPRHTIERSAKQAELEQVLSVERAACVTGIGGTGKTLLALAYAHAQGGRYPGGIWWVDARGAPAAALANLGGSLALVGPPSIRAQLERIRDERDPRAAAELVRLALGGLKEPSLLILDGVDRTGWLDILPGGQTKVLQTTIDRRLAVTQNHVDPSVFRESEAFELSDNVAPAKDDAERSAQKRVTKELLGLFPLAVHIAADTVRRLTSFGYSWCQYEQDLMSDADTLCETVATTGYAKGVDAAISVSVQRCLVSSTERALLLALTTFAPTRVPLSWAAAAAQVLASDRKTLRALAAFEDLGLVRANLDANDPEIWVWGTDPEPLLWLHSLVHERLRKLLWSRYPHELRRTAARASDVVARDVERFLESVRCRWRFAPHVTELLAIMEALEDTRRWLALQQATKSWTGSLGFTADETRARAQTAVDKAARDFGEEHETTQFLRGELQAFDATVALLATDEGQAIQHALAIAAIPRMAKHGFPLGEKELAELAPFIAKSPMVVVGTLLETGKLSSRLRAWNADALELLSRCANASGDNDLLLLCFEALAKLAAHHSDVRSSLRWFRRAYQVSCAQADRHRQVVSGMGFLAALLRARETDRIELANDGWTAADRQALAAELLGLARELGDRSMVAHLQFMAAAIMVDDGRIDDFLREAPMAEAEVAAAGTWEAMALFTLVRASALAMSGETNEFEAAIGRVFALIASNPDDVEGVARVEYVLEGAARTAVAEPMASLFGTAIENRGRNYATVLEGSGSTISVNAGRAAGTGRTSEALGVAASSRANDVAPPNVISSLGIILPTSDTPPNPRLRRKPRKRNEPP